MSDLSSELFETCTHWPALSARLSDASLNIRGASREDAEALQRVVFTVLREYGLPVEPGGTDVDLADVDTHYNDRGGLFVALVNDAGEVLGTAGIYPMDETTCELRKMYFLPSLRGLGLGKRLVQVLMGWAATQGFEVMTLETATCLKEAVALYVHLGFEPYTPEHAVERCDQAWRRTLSDMRSL